MPAASASRRPGAHRDVGRHSQPRWAGFRSWALRRQPSGEHEGRAPRRCSGRARGEIKVSFSSKALGKYYADMARLVLGLKKD